MRLKKHYWGAKISGFLLAITALITTRTDAEIRYSVQPVGDNSRIKVIMRFKVKSSTIELQSPNWSPGYYELKYHGRNIQDLHWTDSSGAPVPYEHPADNAWKGALSKAGETTVEYTAPAQFEAGALHYGGPSAYLYVAGRKAETCRLSLNLPQGWKVAVGLDSIGRSETEYKAPNYDVLADNPVTAGDFIDYHYTSHGKPATIALRGELRKNVDQKKIVKLCHTISDCEGDFFRGVPYHKYVWHFGVASIQDGGGGLEHLSSTQVALAQGVGPVAARVCAHEFFHLWNVKRIRSKPLGPFDYTQLPRTGALYWLEGVTDYYASLLMLRCAYLGEDAFLKDLVDNLTRVRSNSARLEVSPYESSMRMPEENKGLGNGSGWRISYYDLGWLAAMCLDIDLRSRTNGKKSLDDVERSLWNICKNDRPGFEEGEIERQYVRMGGSRDFFEKVIMRPGELPIEDALEKVGLRIEQSAKTFVDKGFDTSTTLGSPVISADSVRPFAVAAGLTSDDVLLEINGKTVVGTSMDDSLAKLSAALGNVNAGDLIRLRIRHKGAEKEVAITAIEASTPVFTVVDAANDDPKKLAMRKSWYFAGAK